MIMDGSGVRDGSEREMAYEHWQKKLNKGIGRGKTDPKKNSRRKPRKARIERGKNDE